MPQDRRDSDVHVDGFLRNNFDRRDSPFETILCESDSLDKQFSQLRYKVFCEEHPEYNQSYNIDQTETDEFDSRSISVLLLFKPLQMIIGGMRVIVPDANKEGVGLPCLIHPDSPFRLNPPFDPIRTGEISRFMVSRERVKIIRDYAKNNLGLDLDKYPSFVMFLSKRLCDISKLYGLDGYCAMLSPGLLRIINSSGIRFSLYGEPVEWHGQRQTVYLNVQEQLTLLQTENIKIRNFLIDNYNSLVLSGQSCASALFHEIKLRDGISQ